MKLIWRRLRTHYYQRRLRRKDLPLAIREYLQAFKESNLECVRYYPIRNGRRWMLYLIRFGLIPEGWFRHIIHYELRKRREENAKIRHYKDLLFFLKKE